LVENKPDTFFCDKNEPTASFSPAELGRFLWDFKQLLLNLSDEQGHSCV
jgi:hypothetical protein